MKRTTKGFASPLLKLSVALLLLTSSAQAQEVYNQERLKQVTKEGTKVYVSANKDNAEAHTKEVLRNWGHWEVVDNKGDADIIFKVKSNQVFMSENVASAVIYDAKTGEKLYKTKNVNTFGRISYHSRKAVIKKLVRKVKNKLIKRYGNDGSRTE